MFLSQLHKRPGTTQQPLPTSWSPVPTTSQNNNRDMRLFIGGTTRFLRRLIRSLSLVSSMRRPNSRPSLVPQYDVTVFIVLDDYGKNGKVYRETDEARADLHTVVTDIIEGQCDNPSRVVAFNTSEGWSRDVTDDVAREILEGSRRAAEPLEGIARTFVELATGERV